MRHYAINRMSFPHDLVARAAREAALQAMTVRARAPREVAMPRPMRRPLQQIHGEVLAADRLAARLAVAS